MCYVSDILYTIAPEMQILGNVILAAIIGITKLVLLLFDQITATHLNIGCR